jgi:hypothetical protein
MLKVKWLRNNLPKGESSRWLFEIYECYLEDDTSCIEPLAYIYKSQFFPTKPSGETKYVYRSEVVGGTGVSTTEEDDLEFLKFKVLIELSLRNKKRDTGLT